MTHYRYPWPGSAIDADLMRRLYMARESSPEHKPITELIALAVRTAYGQSNTHSENQPTKENYENTDPHSRAENRRHRPIQGRQPARTGTYLGLRAA